MTIFVAGGRRDSFEDSLEDNLSFDFMPNLAGMLIYIARFSCTLANIPSYDRSLPFASRFAALHAPRSIDFEIKRVVTRSRLDSGKQRKTRK